MNNSPLSNHHSLRIGTVEFVSPSEIKVKLDLEAPDGIAANAGTPRKFPRINSYLLISTENGFIVGQVEWIAIEHSKFPKRKGFKDYGLVDLPFPSRKLKLNPLGILKVKKNDNYFFERGVKIFPSVGEPVLIPTDRQLKSIIESGENRRVKIGTSPIAANAEVKVDPNKLFGRHLAILGNTGSGKSCTVSGLIQWSLDASLENPNARFIILDPNGEYSKVFKGKGKIFKVNSDENPLEIPMWFWNSHEWLSFSKASSRAQAPLLKQALRAMRNEEYDIGDNKIIETRKFIKTILNIIKIIKNKGIPWSNFPKPKMFNEKVKKWRRSLEELYEKIDNDNEDIKHLIDKLNEYNENRNGEYPPLEATVSEIDDIIDSITNVYKSLGGTENEILSKNEDIPIKFPGKVFLNYLDTLAQETGNEQYIEFLLARIRTILNDTRMKPIIGDEVEISLREWLYNYIGKIFG